MMQHFASTRRALFGLGRGGGGGKEGGASGILFAWGCSGVSPLRLSIHREERKENPILVVCVWPRGEWINSNPIKQTPNRVKGNTVSFFYFRFSSCFFFLSLCVCVSFFLLVLMGRKRGCRFAHQPVQTINTRQGDGWLHSKGAEVAGGRCWEVLGGVGR